MIRAFALICMLCACTPTSTISLTVQEQRDCMKIFEEIIKIQDERNSYTDEMGVINQLRKERQISKKKHRAFYTAWIKKENDLATRANDLYIDGYAQDCFKETGNYEKVLGVDE